MVELEADDALATAAARFAADPAVDQVLICTPDKDLAQCVRDGRVVLRDRRRDLVYDDAGVRAKWGVPPAAIPDWLALVGDAADGFPGIPGFGAVAASTLLAAFGTLEGVREAPVRRWPASVRGAARLAGRSASSWADALLFRQLATLRARRPAPRAAADELRWPGTDAGAWGRSATAGSSRAAPPAASLAGRVGLPRGATRREPGVPAAGGRRHRAGAGRDHPGGLAEQLQQARVVGGRGRQQAHPVAAAPRSNHGPPAMSVTIAPARSAIRPAAAMSQGERPFVWL